MWGTWVFYVGYVMTFKTSLELHIAVDRGGKPRAEFKLEKSTQNKIGLVVILHSDFLQRAC